MRSLDGMLTEDDNETGRPCPDSRGVVDTRWRHHGASSLRAMKSRSCSLRTIVKLVSHELTSAAIDDVIWLSTVLCARQALVSFTVPASASMSNEMILHAVTMASQLSNVTAAFVFHSGNVLINRIPRTCAS
jgi:hypothetical protein